MSDRSYVAITINYFLVLSNSQKSIETTFNELDLQANSFSMEIVSDCTNIDTQTDSVCWNQALLLIPFKQKDVHTLRQLVVFSRFQSIRWQRALKCTLLL